jgi:hypothetical protein
MGITAYRGFLIRVLALAVAASTLTASEMALVWAEGQSPSFKSKSSPSKQYEIKRFELLPISPQPIVIGTSTVGEFVIQVEYSGKSDVTSKEISAIVDRLRVVIDGRLAPLRTKKTDFKSTDANEFFGSVAFTLEQGDVGSTFLGLILAESHQLRLLDPETNLESNVVVVRIQSFPRSQQRIFLVFLTLVCGVLIFALFALLRARRMRAEAHRLRAEAVAIRPTTRPDNSVTDDSRPPLPLPEVPKPLLTALSDGCAMVVLGSGASAQAGFPTGPAFLDLLLQRLRDRLPKGLAQSFGPNDESTSRRIPFRVGEFNKVMDAIVSAVPREQIVKEVREISDRVDPDSDFHEKLAELPWRGVLSFNWDTFAESVFIERRSRNGDWQKFGLDDAAHLAAAVRAGRRLFLRPLGDLDRPATLSLSIEEFRRNLTRWPEFKRQLGLLLQTQTFIFIGVGPDTLEQFLQSVGADLEVADQRHFALVPDSHDNGLLGATLSRFGVALLPYTADPNHRAVSDFVSSLAKRARSSAPTRRAHAKAASNELTISRIEGLRLKNIGLFDDLELKLQTAAIPGTETPWTVIFGPNGCGKSSILRAIGLAFCGNEATDAAGRLLQFGKEEGSIEVQFGSHLLRTRLIRDREVIVAAGQSTPVQAGLALVLGFPALRGAVSGNPRGVAPLDMRAPEPADLLPMVNGEVDRRLGSFKQWLINVLEQAGRGDGRALAMKALVDGIIRDVVPGEFKKLAPLDNSYVIRVKTSDSDKPSPDDVPFDDLSQGMTSIFN